MTLFKWTFVTNLVNRWLVGLKNIQLFVVVYLSFIEYLKFSNFQYSKLKTMSPAKNKNIS